MLAAPSTRRHARHPITTKAITAERHWSPPTTNGRRTFLNGNIAWKEQLISRDEDDLPRSKGEGNIALTTCVVKGESPLSCSPLLSNVPLDL